MYDKWKALQLPWRKRWLAGRFPTTSSVISANERLAMSYAENLLQAWISPVINTGSSAPLSPLVHAA